MSYNEEFMTQKRRHFRCLIQIAAALLQLGPSPGGLCSGLGNDRDQRRESQVRRGRRGNLDKGVHCVSPRQNGTKQALRPGYVSSVTRRRSGQERTRSAQSTRSTEARHESGMAISGPASENLNRVDFCGRSLPSDAMSITSFKL